MGMKGRLGVCIVLSVLLATMVSAQSQDPDTILINSQDWRDVYSVMLFSSLTGNDAAFLVSDRHSGLILNSVTSGSHVWTVNSRSTPFVTGFGRYVESQGYTVEDFTYDSMNLEYARQFDTTSFIIVDDAVGYNAISVAPYAVVTRSFVLFANQNNIDDVLSVLEEKGATSVLIYGHVDRAVSDALAVYNPDVINQDGDRFANNVEIVKRYQAISGAQQVILTNGEFIESAIMSGREPVLFIGVNNVPDVVRNYIQSSNIRVGVLIGNELVNTATFIRRQVGISVFVKFAQSARSPSSTIAQVEALDMFYLPRHELNLVIEDVTYNAATSQLEVTLGNRVEQAIYAKGSYTIVEGDGSRQTVGDTDSIFIEGNEIRTITYSVDPLDPQSASVDAFVIYGEARNSLERTVEATFCLTCERILGLVDIIDNCNVNMSSLVYDDRRQLFRIGLQNPSSVGCYVDVQLVDVVIAAERVTLALDDVVFLGAAEERSIRIRGELEEEDIEDNPFITARAYYGQRESSLIKVREQRFPLLLESALLGGVSVTIAAAMILVLLLVLLFVWKRRKKK